jgi:hypothetical protein
MSLNFITEFFKRREGLKKYMDKLNGFISDQVLSDKEKQELEQIVTDYKLPNNKVIQIKKDAFVSAYNKLTKDSRLTNNELDLLQDLLNYLDFAIGDTNLDLNLFRKYVNLATIESGVLPDVTNAENNPNIIFKSDEILHYRVYSALRKLKRITKSVQYGGFTASVKITRGLRYRVGNIKVGRTTTEVLTIEDQGMLYITNQRIGYFGQQKQFAVPFEKISSLELRSDGLYIFKDGKEQPYIVTTDDYEVPLAITSFIMNKE